MSVIAYSIAVLGAAGIAASILLLIAAKKFHVEKDPRLDELLEILPGLNCGACGYASCEAFGGALLNTEAQASGCLAGGQEVAEKLAAYLGVSCETVCGVTARIACNGGKNCKDKFEYSSIPTCAAASLISGGFKMCGQACFGLGDCMRACQFNAIKMVGGLAVIDWDKCTGCGACVKACPRGIIHLASADKFVHVMCKNTDNAAGVVSKCSVGCIACGICERECPVDAIHVINNCAIVDYEKCINCGICVQKCPKKIITKHE